MIYENCKEILLKEFELIQNAVAIQEKIRLAVTDRQWTAFEDNLSAMNAVEIKLNELENEREKLFEVFKTIVREQYFTENLDDKARFFMLTSQLPKDQQNDLVSIYRGLKTESIKLKMANENLLAYLNEVTTTLREFVNLAFLERGGKMYTKKGMHFSHDMSSMVLNQSF